MFEHIDGKWVITKKGGEVREAVRAMVKECKARVLPPVYLIGSLKDEKLPREKVEAGKTRVYNAAPVHDVIVDKMFNGGFCQFMYHTRIDNGVCIGINPYGTDWHHLASYLTELPDTLIMAFDFSGFDLSQFHVVH